MRIESRIHVEGDLYRFEIVDMDDVVAVAEGELPESLHLSKTYAREVTAERNAEKWIDKFKSATESVRRKMCGYDPVSACRHTPRSVPVLRKAAKS